MVVALADPNWLISKLRHALINTNEANWKFFCKFSHFIFEHLDKLLKRVPQLKNLHQWNYITSQHFQQLQFNKIF